MHCLITEFIFRIIRNDYMCEFLTILKGGTDG